MADRRALPYRLASGPQLLRTPGPLFALGIGAAVQRDLVAQARALGRWMLAPPGEVRPAQLMHTLLLTCLLRIARVQALLACHLLRVLAESALGAIPTTALH